MKKLSPLKFAPLIPVLHPVLAAVAFFAAVFVFNLPTVNAAQRFSKPKFFRLSKNFFALAKLKKNANSSDTGDFKVAFVEPKNKKLQNKITEEDKKSLQAIADDLNATFAMPRDVLISFEQCDEPNAFYEPSTRQLTVCYELYEDLNEIFKPEYKAAAAREDAVNGAAAFIFFHELGHALIDVYDLPVTGREEDAVDQLSTLILTDGTDEGEKMALHGAMSFALLGDQPDEKSNELVFWDEHSLNNQRFYNIVCLVYGQNPTKYEKLVSRKTLPEERASQCSAEYKQVEKSWSKLLAPFVKE